MDENQRPCELTYFISEKGKYCVITFVGPMNPKTVAALECCLKEIKGKVHLRHIVLQMRDVSQITGEGVRFLTILQTALRSMPAEIRICSLQPKIADVMIRLGVVRPSETSPNLQVALTSFTNSGSNSGSGAKAA